MANEVIVAEYAAHNVKSTSGESLTILDESSFITSQVLDIAALSAAFNKRTAFIRLQSKGTGFWFKCGGSDVAAVANTAGNKWLPADQSIDLYVGPGLTYIDTAATA